MLLVGARLNREGELALRVITEVGFPGTPVMGGSWPVILPLDLPVAIVGTGGGLLGELAVENLIMPKRAVGIAEMPGD